MLDRSHLLILVLAVGGACAGFFAGGWLRSPSIAPDAKAAAQIGTPAKPISLSDPSGQIHSLDEWHGKLIVLNFWASWCGPCREEMPLLDRTQQRLAARGLQVIGVAIDSKQATAQFLDEHAVSYPILINDPDKMADVSVAYGNSRGVLPYTVLIGRDGRILAQRFGNFSESGLDHWLQPHL